MLALRRTSWNSNHRTKERAFSFYELAIALAPSNNSLRFEPVAYAHSESDAPAHALAHYSRTHPSGARSMTAHTTTLESPLQI